MYKLLVVIDNNITYLGIAILLYMSGLVIAFDCDSIWFYINY